MSAIIISATSLLLERQEGMLDRTYIAGKLNKSICYLATCYLTLFLGVTIGELILSELVLYGAIGIIQVTIITTIVFAIFNVS